MDQPSSGAGNERGRGLEEVIPSEEELADLRLILDRTRCIILQQILAHDSGVLARVELEARNPDVNPSTLQYHLDTLVDRDILTKMDASETKRDLPSLFYAVSERGVELLKQVNLYDEIAVWNQLYSQVTTPEHLKQIEEMDRPEPNWYDHKQ